MMILPKMDRGYLVFPKWAWDIKLLSYVCIFIGERLNKGRYAFDMN